MYKILALTIAMVANILLVTAQAPAHLSDWVKYDCESHFWGDDNQGMQLKEVPEKWKNEPAVVLYKQDEKEFKDNGNGNFRLSSCFRNRVIIQNGAALTNFSELHFTARENGGYYDRKTYVGLKIFKADGRVRTVNVKNEWVVEGEQAKLAVPNLEIGDIIDYWYFTAFNLPYKLVLELEKAPEVLSGTPFFDHFYFPSDYPVMGGQFRLLVDDNNKIYFKTLNGNTKVDRKRVQDITQFTVSFGSYSGRKNVIWHNTHLKDDAVKYFIIPIKGYQKQFIKEKGKIEILDRLSDSEIKEIFYSNLVDEASGVGQKYSATIKKLKSIGNENPTDYEFFENFFYYLRWDYLNDKRLYNTYHNNDQQKVSPAYFLSNITWAADKRDVPVELYITTPNHYSRIEDVFHRNELFPILKLKIGDGVFFFNPQHKSLFNYMPISLEGTNAYKLTSSGDKLKSVSLSEFQLPVSSWKENNMKTSLQITFDEAERKLLNVKGKITANGYSSSSYVNEFVGLYDYILDDGNYYDKNDFGDLQIEKDEKVKQGVEKYLSEQEQIKEDYLKDEFSSSFNEDIEELELKLLSDGASHGDEDLEFSFEFQLPGHVKKVGSNYLVNLGKLIGDQVTIEEDQIRRDVEIHMNYARNFINDIEIELPQGYSASGLDKFIINVENETGAFISTLEQEGGTLRFTTQKVYKHKTEPKENWPALLEILDAANEFYIQKILLKKIP